MRPTFMVAWWNQQLMMGISISDRLGRNAMDAYIRMQDWDSVASIKDIAGGSYIVAHSILYIGVTICT